MINRTLFLIVVSCLRISSLLWKGRLHPLYCLFYTPFVTGSCEIVPKDFLIANFHHFSSEISSSLLIWSIVCKSNLYHLNLFLSSHQRLQPADFIRQQSGHFVRYISPHYHIVYDKRFDTVSSDSTLDLSETWIKLFLNSWEVYLDNPNDPSPPLEDFWLPDTEWRQVQSKLSWFSWNTSTAARKQPA